MTAARKLMSHYHLQTMRALLSIALLCLLLAPACSPSSTGDDDDSSGDDDTAGDDDDDDDATGDDDSSGDDDDDDTTEQVEVPPGIGDIAPECYPLEAELEVGTGEHKWIDITAGDDIVMVHGPQGGWHILASARLWNTRSIVDVEVAVRTADSGIEFARDHYRVALLRETTCDGFYPGMYAYLDDLDGLISGDADTPPELLAYSDIVLSIEAWDSDDKRVVVELPLTAVPDPMDVDKFDLLRAPQATGALHR